MVRMIMGAGVLLAFAYYMMPSESQVQAVEAQREYQKDTKVFLEQQRVARSIMNDDRVVELAKRVRSDLDRERFNPAWYIMGRLEENNPDIVVASLSESGEMTFTNEAKDVKVACRHIDQQQMWLTECMATSLNEADFIDKTVY